MRGKEPASLSAEEGDYMTGQGALAITAGTLIDGTDAPPAP